MASIRIYTINSSDMDNPFSYLKSGIDFIMNPEKTDHGLLAGSLNCDMDTAFQEMVNTKKQYGKTDMRQGYQVTISFDSEEMMEAKDILQKFVQTYIGEEYECVYAIHNDTEVIHGHVLFNSVSRLSGARYHHAMGDEKMQKVIDSLCKSEKKELAKIHQTASPVKETTQINKPCKGIHR